MRILYIDIDSLRPDHLGCYGYHRGTSPNIDAISSRAVRFTNCYASDVPCLPSRTALFGGRFGIHNGVINHGGVASEPFPDGVTREFRSHLGLTNWMTCLRALGYRTATISSFAERHAAWHFYAGFNEIINPGKYGGETADEVSPLTIEWLGKHALEEKWFLHVNMWDPHTPYRAPDDLIASFKDEPLPGWLTDNVRREHWSGCGPHSAREVLGYGTNPLEWEHAPRWPKQPSMMDSMQKVRMMFDGYDAGVRFADEHVGRICNALADAGVFDETIVIVSADHGENLGELNIYGDHQTADRHTANVPLIIRWPGITDKPRVDEGLICNLDLAATLVELLGGKVPARWDGQTFAKAFRSSQSSGRDHLVISQAAWCCQRGVRFGDWLAIKTYHDAYRSYPEFMLFDLKNDPHELRNVADATPQVVADAMSKLDTWHEMMMRTSGSGVDPMNTVLAEGGGYHARGQLPAYLQRLRKTDRADCAEALERIHSAR